MGNDLISICFYMKDAAFAASDILMRGFGKSKADADAADKAAVSALLGRWFDAQKDDVAIVSKELGSAKLARRKGDGYIIIEEDIDIETYFGPCFFVSGLCGRTAYERGLSGFCVCIAYTLGGKVLASAVYDPVNVAFFHAATGLGAYLNGERIEASPVQHLTDAYVSVGVKALRTSDTGALQQLAQQAMHLRTEETCSLALCNVSCGRTDASVDVDCSFVEYAAGYLIAKEAGAALTKMNKDPLTPEIGARSGIVSASPGIVDALSAITAQF